MMMSKLMITALFALIAGTGTVYAGGDAAAGEAKAASCAGCHGAAGEGVGDNPPVAGLDKAEHFKMLKEYKAGERGDAMMQMFTAQLSEEDMADIAAYYATLGQ